MALSYENYYQLFDVKPDASLEEIQKAYQKAKSIYSPDSPAIYSMFTEEEARELMQVIDGAYNTLSNPISRQQYDLELSGNNNTFEETTSDDSIYGLSGESTGSATHLNHQTDENSLNAQVIQSAPGHRSTKFGSYAIDEEVELYIQNEVNIDGDFLKTVREYKGIGIDQISSYTKIGKHHLNAIEKNDYKELPPVVFVKGFLKQYADILGLDGKKCADNYINIMKQHLE